MLNVTAMRMHHIIAAVAAAPAAAAKIMGQTRPVIKYVNNLY